MDHHDYKSSIYYQQRFFLLLLAIMLFLLATPFLTSIVNEQGAFIARIVYTILFILILVIAAYSISHQHRSHILIAVFAFAVIAAVCVALMVDNLWAQILKYTIVSLFLTYTSVLMLLFVFKSHRVTFNTICASLCVYILLAITWAQFYSILFAITPDSFNPRASQYVAENTVAALYFSFVTITTLGYGDITPATSYARIIAVTEALVGQLYLIVLVARLVGLHIAHSTQNKSP